MSELPETANFYSSLQTRISKQRIAELYRPLAMDVRKCGQDEFEISCNWAELVLEADSPILMHGLVADVADNAEKLLAPLKWAAIAYKAECYDEGGDLIREFAWSADQPATDEGPLSR